MEEDDDKVREDDADDDGEKHEEALEEDVQGREPSGLGSELSLSKILKNLPDSAEIPRSREEWILMTEGIVR